MIADRNRAVIRRWYATRDPSLLDEAVNWSLARSFPVGGRYLGKRAVLGLWWPRMEALFAAWSAIPEQVIAAEDAVVVLGRYEGRLRASGAPVDAPFVHVWQLRDGLISALAQQTDTLLIARAMDQLLRRAA
ncbi:nuclear transport factor 2 family protein [Elioraea sp.]|uniref:nuclear transport factor 2 family protein n=1 Tax=Elioraea sp. TaxID=2185103 RepID=UPI0025C0BE1C|nr:nuclear transport factor 2 family protein [Elioraea sp.]